MSGQVHLEKDGDVAVLVIDNPPVNAGSHDIRKGLLEAIVQVGAVLIATAKRVKADTTLQAFDVDVVLVNGYDFPRRRGGPVHWACQQVATALAQAQACADFARTAGLGRTLGDLRCIGVETGEKS